MILSSPALKRVYFLKTSIDRLRSQEWQMLRQTSFTSANHRLSWKRAIQATLQTALNWNVLFLQLLLNSNKSYGNHNLKCCQAWGLRRDKCADKSTPHREIAGETAVMVSSSPTKRFCKEPWEECIFLKTSIDQIQTNKVPVGVKKDKWRLSWPIYKRGGGHHLVFPGQAEIYPGITRGYTGRSPHRNRPNLLKHFQWV